MQTLINDLAKFQPSDALVYGVDYRTVRFGDGKYVKGFVLLGMAGKPVAVIECEQHSAIQRHLDRIIDQSRNGAPTGAFPKAARAVVRALLNAESYLSDIYNHIVRVYYSDEFAHPDDSKRLNARAGA